MLTLLKNVKMSAIGMTILLCFTVTLVTLGSDFNEQIKDGGIKNLIPTLPNKEWPV
jgi:hypothetical protein